MAYSLAAWLEEWATGSGHENYLDVFLTSGRVRFDRNQRRTSQGKALREHLFGFDKAPASSLVKAAIGACGSSTALAALLDPIVAAGTAGPRGALTAALETAAVKVSALDPAPTLTCFRIQFAANIHTFLPVSNFTSIFESPDRRKKGVYLWCIEHEGALLTNYVGKTWDAGGFERRIAQEIAEYRAGQYCRPVDVDKFKRGERVDLGCSMTPELLRRELDEIVPLYRILLIPLGSDAESQMVEKTIVNKLCENPIAARFLCNKRPHTYTRRGALDFVEGSPCIIGLTDR